MSCRFAYPQPWNVTFNEAVTVGAGASDEYRPENKERKYLFIQNLSNKDLWLNFRDAAVANASILVPARGFYEPLIPSYRSVNMLSSSGDIQVFIMEGN